MYLAEHARRIEDEWDIHRMRLGKFDKWLC
jgi:hypothetical protein